MKVKIEYDDESKRGMSGSIGEI
ncbi:uncharacterized protein G2W53_031581 [Senna tora]|uniref:Uncharacterized protein n=1 Tax=Senna tora TaxID=362788 RepID=A0A834WCL4_9FABA|nr:uncharacterized protein G2W53_031581 [Senna tora]